MPLGLVAAYSESKSMPEVVVEMLKAVELELVMVISMVKVSILVKFFPR